jgi:hypothetical protein
MSTATTAAATRGTATTVTSPSAGVHDALHELTAAAAHACDDARTRAVLAVVVRQLEHAAAAELGDTAGEPLVVLQRRLGRAHRLLAGSRAQAAALDADHVRGLVSALDPRRAPHQRPDAVPVGTAVLAGC